MRRTLLVSLLALAAQAQQIGQNGVFQKEEAVTFKTTARLVIQAVTVKDKQGRTVADLTADDFTLLENGSPQAIRFFDYENLPENPAGMDAVAPGAVTTESGSNGGDGPAPVVRHRNRRLLALYFDFTAMPVVDRLRALSAAQHFAETRMTSADLVTVMVYAGGSVQVVQEFSGEPGAIAGTLRTLSAQAIQGADDTTGIGMDGATGAAFGQNDAEFNIFSTDRQLSALQTASALLGRLNEKKALVYFGSGLRLNGSDNQAQLQATINAAVRAGVSLWPVDARGLTAEAPLGDASQASPGGLGAYSGTAALKSNTSRDRSQDILWTLAADTGGKALFDSNDLSAGVVQAWRSMSSYYLIGYYSSNDAQDGKLRRIQIKVGRSAALQVDYRHGYYGPRVFRNFTLADRERQLEDAMMSGDPLTELTLAMEIDYFQLNRAEYLVPLTVKIPGSELTLSSRGGASHTRIDFIGEIKDAFGATVRNVRDSIDVKLDSEMAGGFADHPVAYETAFTLLPGQYSIKFLARDLNTGRIGTWQMPFLVPDLNRELQTVPISSVVLSSQMVRLDQLPHKAGKKADPVHPLVKDGQKVIPSVTRVFRKSRRFYLVVEAYPHTGPAAPRLQSFLAFYSGEKRVFGTGPVQAAQIAATSRGRRFSILHATSLAGIAPGEYICQLTVTDSGGDQAAFWQQRILIVP